MADYLSRLIITSPITTYPLRDVLRFLESLQPARNAAMRESPAYRDEVTRLGAKGIIPVRERRRGYAAARTLEPPKPRKSFVARPILPPRNPPVRPGVPMIAVGRALPSVPHDTRELPETKDAKRQAERAEHDEQVRRDVQTLRERHEAYKAKQARREQFYEQVERGYGGRGRSRGLILPPKHNPPAKLPKGSKE